MILILLQNLVNRFHTYIYYSLKYNNEHMYDHHNKVESFKIACSTHFCFAKKPNYFCCPIVQNILNRSNDLIA